MCVLTYNIPLSRISQVCPELGIIPVLMEVSFRTYCLDPQLSLRLVPKGLLRLILTVPTCHIC